MRFLHLADLHLGKSLYGYSLIENGDQPFWIRQLLDYVDKTAPDAVVISGDVYDRSVPSREAVELLDALLTELSCREIPVMLISGNHDSGPRLNFGSRLLERQNLYIAGKVSNRMTHVTLSDRFGPIHFWLMPYLFPAAVRVALGTTEEIGSYHEAVCRILSEQQINRQERNVLVAHQFVVSGGKEPERGGSETVVGGIGGVDASAFDDFDYVALGHIHGAQWVGKETIRYAGAPLCYHFSEAGQKKGPLLVTIGEKGMPLTFETGSLPSLHPMRQLKGSYQEILTQELSQERKEEYLRVVLTDQRIPAGAAETLRSLFESRGSYLMELAREALLGEEGRNDPTFSGTGEKSLEELFSEFYIQRTGGQEPDLKEAALIHFAAEQVRNLEEDQLESPASPQALVNFALEQEEGG